jgi:hypothetical protein
MKKKEGQYDKPFESWGVMKTNRYEHHSNPSNDGNRNVIEKITDLAFMLNIFESPRILHRLGIQPIQPYIVSRCLCKLGRRTDNPSS